MTTSTTSSPGELKTGESGGDCGGKASGDGGTGGDQPSKADELLKEATQLLRTLQVTPKIKVMQLEGLERAEEDMALVDSGATHGLRPAQDLAEWNAAEPTVVQLANGSTEAFKVKRGTKILLSHPEGPSTLIVPMSALGDLDYRLEWAGGVCTIRDDVGRTVNVTISHGCPMISNQQGRQLLEWWEFFHLYQRRKLAMINTMMSNDALVDKGAMTLDMAVTLKMRHEFPGLPDHVLAKLIPNLDMLGSENFGSMLPWNRHKRRRLLKAKNIVLHLYSGPDHKFWEKQCSSNSTEVLCVDICGPTKANMHDRNIFGYILSLCASGRVRTILAGPPCRTVSALRYQQDGGPPVLRTDDFPYGLPDLAASDADLVLGDVVLWYRMLALYIVAEDVRAPCDPPTQLVVEQPEDPARYRSAAEVEQHQFFSNFRTKEWKDFAMKYGIHLFHCDQFPMGHPKRKPTTLATSVVDLWQLDGIRGGPPNEAEAAAQFKAMSIEERCNVSKSWASWAPGLKLAIATAVKLHLQALDLSAKRGLGDLQPDLEGRHASLPPLEQGPETCEHFFRATTGITIN
eukprot:s1132_g13.t2